MSQQDRFFAAQVNVILILIIILPCTFNSLSAMQLDSDLQHFSTLDIPAPVPREWGMMDVVGRAQHENTISNVYRYFLHQERSPLLSRVLMESLFELIKEKHEGPEQDEKQLDLSNFIVRREATTKSQKRIDLLIESQESQSAIIIEVKVYASLHNNLTEYWNHINFPEEKKAGVVLSLEKMNPQHFRCPHFVNITHAEWLNRAWSKVPPGQLPKKDGVYFNDFVYNMNRLTRSMEMTDRVRFYIENAQRINEAAKTKVEASTYVIRNFKTAMGILHWENNWDKDNKWARAYPGPGEQQGNVIWFRINPNEIVEHLPVVRIGFEMKRFDEAERVRLEMHNTLSGGQWEKLFTKGGNKGSTLHIACKTFTINPSDDKPLHAVISEELQKMNRERERLIQLIPESARPSS